MIDEVAQQRRIVRTYGRSDRRPCGQVLTPARDLRLVAQNPKVADLVEHVEIAEDRTEHGIDQREFLAVEPWSDEARFQPLEALLELRGFGVERRLVGCRIEPRDIVEDGRAELDKGAMLGAA